MTLREIQLYSDGRNIRAKEEYRQKISLTLLAASLARTKKLPKLETLLPREEYKTTPEERKANVWSFIESVAAPGEIKRGKKKKERKS